MRKPTIYEKFVKPVVDRERQILGLSKIESGPGDKTKLEGAYDGEEIVSIFWTSPLADNSVDHELPPCITTLISYLMDEEGKSIEDALSFFIRLQTCSDQWGNDMLLGPDPVTRGDTFTVHFAVQGTEETGWDTHEKCFVFSDPGVHATITLGG